MNAAAHRTRPQLRAGAVRAGLALLLLGLLGSAAGQCSLAGDPYEFEVRGLGTAYFQSFRQDPATDSAVFRGDVCITGEGGAWTILTDEVRVEGLRGDLRLEMARGVLLLEGWRIEAEGLVGDAERVRLAGATFSGQGIDGSAEGITLDVATGDVALERVRATGERFRFEAARGRLVEASLILEDAVVTTCVCDGPSAYRVRTEETRLDLGNGRVVLRRGVLETGPLRIRLSDELELGEAALADLRLPVTLEYRGDDPAAGRVGTGLGLLLPSLPVEDGLRLEAGVVGLDPEHPLAPFALLRHKTPAVEFEVGRSRAGPRVRMLVREPLAPDLTLELGIANLHEPAHDFLHEGHMALVARRDGLPLPAGATFDLHGRVLAAASSQALDPAVTDLRLGVTGGGTLRAPLPLGSLELAGGAGATRYPGAETTQWSVRLAPALRAAGGGLHAGVRLERLWTNGASPFTPRLDRLAPSAELTASLRYAAPLGDHTGLDASLALRYDLLPARRGLEEARLRAAVRREWGSWALVPELELELADRLDPAAPGARDSYLRLGVRGRRQGLELGSEARLALSPGGEALETLELYGAAPLELGEVTLRPFLALDAVPLLRAGEPPRLSGHGLELTWRSCCGTVQLGYRQRGSDFVTRFGLALEAAPPPLW